MAVQKNVFIALLLTLMLSSCSEENLTCEDFKEGTFNVYYDGVLKNQESTITRKSNRQVEKLDDSVIYVQLNWTDECSYTAKFDASKTEKKILDYAKEMNDNKGIVVSKLKIKGKCFYFKAKYTINKSEEIVDTGRICKK